MKSFNDGEGLPIPCECKARDNTADVIVSAINFWKPSALLKLLDLSVSHFHWTELNHTEFRDERTWRYVRVELDKRALFYHIHDDGRWQLLGSERLGIEEICTLEDHYKQNWHECHIARIDQMLAGKLDNSFPWHQSHLQEFDFECDVTTKDGYWINIDKSEAADGNATVADKKSISKQVYLQPHSDTEIETATTNATSTKKIYPLYLPGTNKRKHIAE